MNNKRDDEKYKNFVATYLTDGQLRKLKTMAEKQGLSISSLVRGLVLSAIRAIG